MVKKWHLFLSLVCLISGILIVTLFRVHDTISAEAENTNNNKDSLIPVINQLEKENHSLEQNIDDIRQKIDAAQKAQINGTNRLGGLEKEMQTLKMQAGLLEVEGPGITLVLDDNTKGAEVAKNSDLTYDPEKFIIHDKNLLYIVYDLRKAGAEAISINEQKIVTTSNIRCVGTVIHINSTRMAPPYEIKAIGNPDKLEQGVLSSQEYIYLTNKGFPLKLTKLTKVIIPAYKGSYSPSYAKPVKEEDSNNNV
ncbi:DUF881 domain-containing protein [Bacillota bacterium LX-D]|nr:DUF881 domain-containing protein [Bacillota bacterium LX-D]